MSTYVSTQSAEKLLQDMMTQYCDWPSSVYPDMKKLREVLTQLSDGLKLHALQQKYSVKTPLDCAAQRGHTEIIGTLLTSLQSSAYRLKLLTVVGNWTPLHYAALNGHTDSLKVILNCLTTDHQTQLMSVRSCGDMTAIRWAVSRGRTDTLRVLREYKQKAEIERREKYSNLISHILLVSPCVGLGNILIVQHYCVGLHEFVLECKYLDNFFRMENHVK